MRTMLHETDRLRHLYSRNPEKLAALDRLKAKIERMHRQFHNDYGLTTYDR